MHKPPRKDSDKRKRARKAESLPGPLVLRTVALKVRCASTVKTQRGRRRLVLRSNNTRRSGPRTLAWLSHFADQNVKSADSSFNSNGPISAADAEHLAAVAHL